MGDDGCCEEKAEAPLQTIQDGTGLLVGYILPANKWKLVEDADGSVIAAKRIEKGEAADEGCGCCEEEE